MVQQRTLASQLPHPHVAVLPAGEQQPALTGQVHPRDPAVVGGDLADDVPPGQTEQADVAAAVGRYQDAVLELVPHGQSADTVARPVSYLGSVRQGLPLPLPPPGLQGPDVDVAGDVPAGQEGAEAGGGAGQVGDVAEVLPEPGQVLALVAARLVVGDFEHDDLPGMKTHHDVTTSQGSNTLRHRSSDLQIEVRVRDRFLICSSTCLSSLPIPCLTKSRS